MNEFYRERVERFLSHIVFECNEDVFRGNSWIEGGGEGLFAKRKIDEGEVFLVYVGKLKRTVDALRTQDKSYMMRLGEQNYVDSRDTPLCMGRYINDCRNLAGYNARFDKRPSLNRADVVSFISLHSKDDHTSYADLYTYLYFLSSCKVATRVIFPDEEIFVDYGKWYWASGQPSSRLSFSQLRSHKKLILGGH
jgi:SET domain-containing protein